MHCVCISVLCVLCVCHLFLHEAQQQVSKVDNFLQLEYIEFSDHSLCHHFEIHFRYFCSGL